MGYRYYSTQRPVAPGTFPKPEGNKVLRVENFDKPQNMIGLRHTAWGYIEYEKQLTMNEARNYELTKVEPVYMDRETGELLLWKEMIHRFKERYDGRDDTNPLGWEEYFEEIEIGGTENDDCEAL